MKKIYTHIRNLLLLLVLLGGAGCAHDDILLSDIKDGTPDRMVVLRIALPKGDRATRSNPMGGEEGNGREDGVLNENKIHDINIFFYLDDKGLDAGDDTPILYSLYYNLDNPYDMLNSPLQDIKGGETDATLFGNNEYEISFTVSENSVGKEIYESLTKELKFAAVGNAGYLGGVDDNGNPLISTIGALRNIDFSESYASHKWNSYNVSSTKADQMDYFLMSTAYNKEYISEGKSTGTNTLSYDNIDKYTGLTTLERLYARIDLWYNASENAEGAGDADNVAFDKLTYAVEGTENKVYILNVLPVNVMQQPSYMFKKVTDSSPANLISGWTVDFLNGVTEFNWGGKETPDGIPTSSPNDMPTNYVMERHTMEKNSLGTAGNLSDWFGNTAASQIVGDIESGSKGRISDYYHMRRLRGNNDPDYDCDHVSIISYANENTHPVDCFHSNYLTGLAMKALYIPGEIYKDYEGMDGSKSLVPLTREERASFAGGTVYRYTPEIDGEVNESKTLYFSDEDVLKAYAKDHPLDNPIVTTFETGFYTSAFGDMKELGIKCYYNLWLRHYNDENADPQESYPMEYSIVRNNIYRVALSFSGPGDPTPTLREPDTMLTSIYVIKWNFRPQPEIIM